MLKRLILLFALQFISAAVAQIAPDAVTDGGNNGGTTASLTFNHTCTGNNLLLVLSLTGDTSVDDITTVTYNGVAMTLMGKKLGARWNYQYYLLGPATGTHALSVTAASTHYLIGVSQSLANVAQTGQPDAGPVTGTSSMSPFSQTLTTVTPGAWVIQTGEAYGNVAAGQGTSLSVRDNGFKFTYIAESTADPIVTPNSVPLQITWNQQVASASWVEASWAPSTGPLPTSLLLSDVTPGSPAIACQLTGNSPPPATAILVSCAIGGQTVAPYTVPFTSGSTWTLNVGSGFNSVGAILTMFPGNGIIAQASTHASGQVTSATF